MEISPKLITALADLFRPEQERDSSTKTLATLKELGLISPRTQTDEAMVLKKLKAMKEGLGLKYAHEIGEARDDPMEEVENFEDLVEAIRPFIPEKTKPSATPAILEAIGKVGPSLLATIRDLTALSRLNMQYRILTSPPPQTGQREEAKRAENPDHGEDGDKEDAKIIGPGASWAKSMGIKVE